MQQKNAKDLLDTENNYNVKVKKGSGNSRYLSASG